VARTCPNPACAKSYSDDAAFCGECGSITVQDQSGRERDPRLGQQIGDYVVVAHVADGAMGRVYEGRHVQTRARVAIKVLHPEVARDQVAAERFKREYEAARDMDHPHIVKALDFGLTSDGLNFMTMEFLEGEELGHVLRRGKPLEPARIVRIATQLGLGLEYAHSFGFIHRDLKPDNIFLCRGDAGDTVRILDFGSVKLQIETGPKLTAFGTTLGSPYYMSPEQAMGRQDVDQRTDVFAMGAIVYECLTGKVAFEGANVAQILMKIISGQPIPASQQQSGLPPRIDDLLDRALHKDKTKRYSTGVELASDLCRAYGLEADVQRWATSAQPEIAAALDTVQPPAARAFGAPSSSPPPASRSLPPGALSDRPLSKSSSGLMIGVAVGALAIVALLAVLLMR
jgi:serine/threonine protein kinase